MPFVRAIPLPLHATTIFSAFKEEEGMDGDDTALWLYLTVAAVLVLAGGAFAGLTIALMGQVSSLVSRG